MAAAYTNWLKSSFISPFSGVVASNASNTRLEFKQVQQFLSNVQASFQYFNQSKSGRLDKSEVLRALNHAGFGHVDEGAVKAACQAFDPDRTNSLSLDQYIAMTLFLLISKRVFEAFDATTPENGLIKLDFNQFVYAAAKTR